MAVKISEAENAVMEVLWDRDEWLDVAAVSDALPDNKWAYNTVATFLLRLTEKGMLEAGKQGRNNVYRPLIDREQYKRAETEEFLNSVHHGSRKSLFAALYGDELSDDEIDKLLEWVEKR